MSEKVRLVRRSYFVDPRAAQRAKRVLGVNSESAAVRAALAEVVEMATFWRFMARTHGKLKSDAIERP